VANLNAVAVVLQRYAELCAYQTSFVCRIDIVV
jgi:hypothetical protein